ncbi:DciA family protein [Roseibacterium sp. SDUM158017]|uniref:DUF721 domain-containing protein n=1 Tax=Roseicyclus salinarum TaxID=3036773 RepID=UPI0024153126|nr:DciA family protein [Roseibacterium sp. SDUM158017]MDG4646828.1 DciA family protein [Roseibacterium sp. SDUM158017]
MVTPRQDTKAPNARRKRGFERASTLVSSHLRAAAEKRGFAEARLLTHWADIVGADIADIAVPLRISYGRGFGGTLVLLTTGANAPILEMRGAEIVELVNACYGYRAVARIQVTQTARTGFSEGRVAFRHAETQAPRTPDPERLAAATSGLEDIEDEGLRSALEALARNVVAR